MFRRYFPKCEKTGDVYPGVPFVHGYTGRVPTKCYHCDYLFEGECTRDVERSGLLHLDHGSCQVEGETDPVRYEDRFIVSTVEVPRKCASCGFLAVDSIRGFHCQAESEIWGGFTRGLDWGGWQPEGGVVRLPDGYSATTELADLVRKDDEISFLRLFRRRYPGVSLEEGRRAFEFARATNQEDSNG